MSRIEPDIAAWQREGSLFGCYDDPRLPGDRLCVETHNVFNHDRMVQVGPFHVHKAIHSSYFYPPRPDDYFAHEPALGTARSVMGLLGLILLGIGTGLLIPL
jgi:hypothetical protein